MEKQQILKQLEALEAELDKLGDSEQSQALQAKVAEIQAGIEDEPEGFADSFDHFASDFEADHPTLAGLIRDISTRLAALGI